MDNLRVYGHNCITQQGHSAQSDLFWRLHFSATALYRGVELELELIQTQMAQKPVLRAEVYAHAMRASQNRRKEVRREKEV